MNKVTFTFEDGGRAIQEFKTRADWDRYKKRLFNTSRYIPDCEPDKFPCIAIQGGWHCEAMGFIEEHYVFIDDYTIEVVEKF